MELSPGTVAPDPKLIFLIVFFDCGFGFHGPGSGELLPIARAPDEPDVLVPDDDDVSESFFTKILVTSKDNRLCSHHSHAISTVRTEPKINIGARGLGER